MKINKITPVSNIDLSGETTIAPAKKRYKVILNWYGENRRFYVTCRTKPAALNYAIRRLAKDTGVSLAIVKLKIRNSKESRYLVTEI